MKEGRSDGEVEDGSNDGEVEEASKGDAAGQGEPWEDEVTDMVRLPLVSIRGWKDLRDQVKDDLKKKAHTFANEGHQPANDSS
jgi:hypothetical protein